MRKPYFCALDVHNKFCVAAIADAFLKFLLNSASNELLRVVPLFFACVVARNASGVSIALFSTRKRKKENRDQNRSERNRFFWLTSDKNFEYKLLVQNNISYYNECFWSILACCMIGLRLKLILNIKKRNRSETEFGLGTGHITVSLRATTLSDGSCPTCIFVRVI